MEWGSGNVPQLSNEMQLIIMNKVKRGELSIDDALNQARQDRELLRKQKSTDQVQEPDQSLYNFSVHKHGRYRWQKRVIQFDFNSKLLCSIEKGIVKRQLSFSIVKSCDDGAGSRFSISFKEHHDYELEATSVEDKHKMMELVNKIIYDNIYSAHEEGSVETAQPSTPPPSVREGVLLLHRGGLASFRWVRYQVQLLPGQLVMVPLKRRSTAEGEMSPTVATVIHLSDGNTTVQKTHSPETFSLTTNKNEYHFRIPPPEAENLSISVKSERDEWIQAIDKLCKDWKRKSHKDHTGGHKTGLPNQSIAEEEDDNDLDQETASKKLNNDASNATSDNVYSNAAISWEGAKPVPKRRVIPDVPNLPNHSTAGHSIAPPPYVPKSPMTQNSVPMSPTSNRYAPMSPKAINIHPQSPFSPHSSIVLPPPSPTSPNLQSHISALPKVPSDLHPQPVVSVLPPTPSPPPSPQSPPPAFVPPPPLPKIPPPPPLLPIKARTLTRQNLTRPFHWDIIGPDKISKSFWGQIGNKTIEIDTSRLYEQFAVKKTENTHGPLESIHTQNIMLNQKVAHNFSIFLKSFPVSPGELKDRLFIVKEVDGGLSDEHITALRRYVPTIDDVEMYKSHKGPVSELHVVDQYMMEMCNIPYLSVQLDLLLTLRELPVSMKDLQPLINQKIRMCQQLYDSRLFVSVLAFLLAIGNYLNENAGKEKAKGIRLSSLTKTVDLRGKDRDFTLLHALVEQILALQPSLVFFTDELAEFETDPGASIKGLTAEVDVLKNELQKVVQYRKASKKRKLGDAYPNFLKDLKFVIEKYQSDLSLLTKACEEMKKLYSVILVKFGEPADLDSQELFGVICQFIHDFKRAHAETV
ncbi:unnamed protein product [Knipowitschia caucasica]